MKYWISVWATLLFSSPAFSQESVARPDEPYLYPQTNFFVGNGNYTVELSNAGNSFITNLNSSSLNVFGFDLEVNHSKNINIGAYMRIETIGVASSQYAGSLFSTLIGGFTRFYYVPSFMRTKSFMTDLFFRLELGGGPIILSLPSGLVLQTGTYVGIETYINKWIGFSLSYGFSFEYGQETLAGNATIWNRGTVMVGALKTTLF